MPNTQSKQKRLRSTPLAHTEQDDIYLEDIQLENHPVVNEEGKEDEAPLQTNTKGKAKMSKRAPFWAHFLEIKDDKGYTAKAQCKHCSLIYAAHSKTNGTANLRKHWKSCQVNPNNHKRTPQTAVHSSSMSVVDVDDVRRKLCKLIIGEEMAFDFVQKFLFRDLFASSCPGFTVPCRSTVIRDAYKMYTEEREKLMMFLKKNSQRICLTTDTWTSIQNVNYMVLTAHFIDNQWNLQRRVLNFCTISGHKGNEIARDVEDCLRSWDLCDKIFTLTMDNAKANDTTCSKLQEMLVSNGNNIRGGKDLHMRCCAHIANLIVKDGLKEHVECIDKVRNVVKFVRP